MKFCSLFKAFLVATAVATLCTACTLPETLHGDGLVCEAKEDPARTHKHKSTFDDWKIVPNVTHLQIQKWKFTSWRHFIDALNEPPTGLQDIDMHVVNRNKNPLPNKLGLMRGCARPNIDDSVPYFPGKYVEDFVFAFGIHEIQNSSGTEPASPHAIIYLPLHTKQGPPWDTAQEFRILLFHMEPDETACTTGSDPMKKRCVALAQLRQMWKPGDYWNGEFKAKLVEAIKTIVEPEFAIKYHNGVIHGTL